MARSKRESWVTAAVAATFTFMVGVYATSALANTAAAGGADVSGTDPFTAFVTFLKSTGPLGAAVLAGWWALRKDREKNELAVAYQAQFKAMYDQVVEIVRTQTAATTKMEGTIAALKDAIVALKGNDHDGA